jgi:glucose/arabinose dehydrogenase
VIIHKQLMPAFAAVISFVVQPGHAACLSPDGDAPIPPIALKEVVRGLSHPVHVTHAGDGSHRLYVVEQDGVIRVIERGRLLTQAFLDIRNRVNSGGEKGLLSVAFHPRHRENGLLYVNYTMRARGLHTIVAEFKRGTSGRVEPESERVLLKIKQPYGNHNGGQIAFAPDGYLYVGMGDGGAANDPFDHGQNTRTLLGALLRIDVNRRSDDEPYTVPPDNPFVGQVNYVKEIWALGLRNPWRFSFDAVSGQLFLADVGQDDEEEINIIKKGGNYGWNIMEGMSCTPGVVINCNKTGLELPIFAYPHPEGFSITGGFVYRGEAIPGLCGVYVYGDYVSQRIWGLRYDGHRVTQQRELLKTRHAISSFGEDETRELYVADHGGGKIMKIVPAGQ